MTSIVASANDNFEKRSNKSFKTVQRENLDQNEIIDVWPKNVEQQKKIGRRRTLGKTKWTEMTKNEFLGQEEELAEASSEVKDQRFDSEGPIYYGLLHWTRAIYKLDSVSLL